ncbi:hypothetical protein FB192DRAFT_1016893 [Mucor lusitanicus]|uniref:Uncharacterized protein n=1 Tax=Mucor circinelloides f. lusitanicus TaxID=29924 RepID=A0A8H4BTD6_MUCCL|nr:hypothetical protein FB192DRAFT_1016893 [Mucor lusitanicus]
MRSYGIKCDIMPQHLLSLFLFFSSSPFPLSILGVLNKLSSDQVLMDMLIYICISGLMNLGRCVFL